MTAPSFLGQIEGLGLIAALLLILTPICSRVLDRIHNRYGKPDNVIEFPAVSNVRYLDSRRRAE